MADFKVTKVFKETIRAFVDGKRRCLNEGGTSSSKCLGRGTRVVMSDLSLKNVEDVVVGDNLMGVDGKPRKVLKLYRGVDDLYKIKQHRGIDYVVSSNHILSLKENWKEVHINIPGTGGKRKYRQEHTYEVINMPLPEYMKQSGKWKRRHKGWKCAGVELPEHNVLVEPYYLGLWLGDGTNGNTNITNTDQPVIDYLKWFAIRENLRYVKIKNDDYGHALSKTSGKTNPLRQGLIHYGVLTDKRIPKEYLNNSRRIRLELLAGLMDSDGYATGRNTLGISQIKKDLSEDIMLLTRSLGFYTSMSSGMAKMKRKDGSIYQVMNYKIEFTGDTVSEIPMKVERKRIKNKPLPRRLVSGFDVESIGKGEYFGFELDGDRLFLLEDFTVTHNSYSIIQALIYIAQESKTPMLISIISESLPHLKRGCIRDFFNILGESQDNNPCWSKTEFKYKKPGWKGEFEFFGADEETKMRGGRRDILFVNEGNNIAWEAVRQADIRTQRFTLVDWNPSGEFWVYEYWMDKPTSDKKYFSETGYVQEFGDNVLIHSTYMDAREVIPLQTIKDIEAYKDTDPDWWRVYGLGELGKMDGLVYPSFEIVDEMPLGSFFCGLDFGFTNDPAALSVNTIIDDELYSKQLIYKRGLTNDVLAREMDLVEWKAGGRTFRGVTGLQLIADSAEPKSIEEIRRKGFNIIPCEKGKGSVEYGIQKVNQYRHYITKDSVEGIKEYRNLRYKKDKLTGQFTDKFVGEDHFCDSVRYAVSTRRMLGSRLPIGVSKRSSLVIDKVYNGFRLPISLNRR